MNVNSYAEASQQNIKNIPTPYFSHLSLVSLTPVINFRISPRIFVRIRNDPNKTLRGPGETYSRKNLKSKMSCQTLFNLWSRRVSPKPYNIVKEIHV
jgi:hypothetical protein